jgi:CRISPR-associated protein Csm3
MAMLLYKLEITGVIEVLTGLHIGGPDVDLNIGGIDNEVAKHNKKPYIPGSSLAGKLRHLIAKQKGYKDIKYDRSYLALLFSGVGFNPPDTRQNSRDKDGNFNKGRILAPHTRLLVRDSFMIDDSSANIDDFLEDKAENVINRTTGKATPRHLERVVSGTKFRLNMIMDVYENDDVIELCKTLNLGFSLLNNDYLGGSGSRGYGAVKITIDPVKKIDFSGGSIAESNFTEYLFN